MSERIKRWLGSRYAPLVGVLLGLALSAPALEVGFAADDHLHRVLSRDDPGIEGLESRPRDLFVFSSGDPGEVRALIDEGVFPWWTDPQAKLAFMRPISSLTHAVDHRLWPEAAPLHMAHSLLWLGIALAMIWLLYRRFIEARWVAVLALILYAVDDARGPVIGWIANRNALVALALAIAVLLVHDRWRRESWRPGTWLGPLLLGVALLAGESALAITAYLAAHALHIDRGSWRSRVASLVPYGAVVIAWRLAYQLSGYGVHGSGIYIDPGSSPAVFAELAAQRFPLLLAGQLALPWSDLGTLYPLMGPGVLLTMVLIAVGTLALLGFVVWPLVRIDPVSRFFVTGMLLAAVPICSTFPADRLLVFVGIGGAGIVARLLAAALAERERLGATRARRAVAVSVAGLLVLIHLVMSPPLLALRARAMVDLDALLEVADQGIPKDESITGKTVLIVSAPADPWGGYIPLIRESHREPRPDHLYWLANASSPMTVERTSQRALRITLERGFVERRVDQMLRSPRRPFEAGQRIELAEMTIVIDAVTIDGRPQTVTFELAHPTDDPRYVWRRWKTGVGYVPYEPPAVGQSQAIEPIDFVELVTGGTGVANRADR